MRLSSVVVFAAAAVVMLTGCGGKSDGTVSVSGTVKIDGESISKEGYGVRFEVEDRQIVIDVNPDGTFEGVAFEGKGNAWLAGGYTYPEPSASPETDVVPDQGQGDAQAEYSPVEVELTSEASIELDFSSQ